MRKDSVEKGGRKELVEVNITPLGDVSLTLIIILMVISPMIMQSMIKVHSSKAVKTTQVEKAKEKPLFVRITDEAIYLNTEKIESEEEFSIRLAKELENKKQKSVMITANREVLHGRVVHILDLSRQSGAVKLSLLKGSKRKTSKKTPE
ncbi:MAG: ExbD/TolR family protein [bacterium]